jgi:hypothetical protein
VRTAGRALLAAGLACLLLAGCGESRLPTAPVQGKVLYNGKPLEFGAVRFQPELGPPASGFIQPDGTFELSTYKKGDGAIIGQHQVAITCFESQRPGFSGGADEEMPLGKSLIPQKYTQYYSSQLTREVKEENEPFVFELSD